MSIIVLHKPTDKKFILISIGYETPSRTNHTDPLYGSLHIEHNNCPVEMAAVCDREGHISSISSDELVVLKIDGVSPSQIVE